MLFNTVKDRTLKAAVGTAVAVLLCSAPAYGACSITAAPIAFGAYNSVTKAAVNATTTVTVRCDALVVAVNYSVSVSPGQSGNVAARYLVSGVNQLTYQVYSDPARTRIAGDGSAGTTLVAGSVAAIAGIGTTSDSVQLYPVLNAGQSPVPGTYTDTLIIMVSY